MVQDPLYKYAKQIVDEKEELPQEIKQQMIVEILSSMNDYLDMELVSRLSPEATDQLNKLLDNNVLPEVVTKLFEDNGVDIQNATIVALSRFKKAYYGE